MLKYHHHFVPYYSESLMLFFQIFLALLLRRQPEEVGNNKLEQLEAVFNLRPGVVLPPKMWSRKCVSPMVSAKLF